MEHILILLYYPLHWRELLYACILLSLPLNYFVFQALFSRILLYNNVNNEDLTVYNKLLSLIVNSYLSPSVAFGTRFLASCSTIVTWIPVCFTSVCLVFTTLAFAVQTLHCLSTTAIRAGYFSTTHITLL